MARAFRLNSTRALCLGAAVLLGMASGAAAQQSSDPGPGPVNSSESLHLPENPELFASVMPPIIKATAIVNGDVITQTDVDQRLAFLSIASGQPVPAYPNSEAQYKNNGWEQFSNPTFKNHGQCTAWVNAHAHGDLRLIPQPGRLSLRLRPWRSPPTTLR